jgi:hypothetical protein
MYVQEVTTISDTSVNSEADTEISSDAEANDLVSQISNIINNNLLVYKLK